MIRKTRLRKVGKAGAVHKRMHAIWRDILLLRDGKVCSRCQTTEGVFQAHHIYPKVKYARLRYHLPNGMILCNGCHTWISRNATGFEEVAFYRRVLDGPRLAALALLSEDRSKPKVDLKAVELWLTQQLKGAAK